MTNSNYRIIIETTRSGQKYYYVQKRYLRYFWFYLSEVRDVSMTRYRLKFDSLEKAESHIKKHVEFIHQRKQSKVIKREIYIP